MCVQNDLFATAIPAATTEEEFVVEEVAVAVLDVLAVLPALLLLLALLPIGSTVVAGGL